MSDRQESYGSGIDVSRLRVGRVSGNQRKA